MQAIPRAACLGSERQRTCLLNLINLIPKEGMRVILASSQSKKKSGRTT